MTNHPPLTLRGGFIFLSPPSYVKRGVTGSVGYMEGVINPAPVWLNTRAKIDSTDESDLR